MDIKEKFETRMGAKVTAVDDENLIKLREKYVGKMTFDKDGGRVLACLGCESDLSQRTRVLGGLMYSGGVC